MKAGTFGIVICVVLIISARQANDVSVIHINDLAAAYVTITEEALKHNGGAATWGPEGTTLPKQLGIIGQT